MKTSGGSVALDTTAYAQFRRGHALAGSRIATAAEVVIPVIVVGELLAGFAVGSRRRENEVVLDAFLSEEFVRLVPATREVADVYGELFAKLRTKGRPIPTNDLWIAATAITEGAVLLTFDSDFDRIDGLRVERLRP
ncbi:MAG: type II toxin-antitoxin system VapC family toxin [Myxococcaceae bacterium]|nr:type II toxin-antitoxin system VapC family toxin [Myxococcaceae bacterium]